MLASAYPVMLWLVDTPSFAKLLAVELWLSFLYGSYNGAMVVFLTEIMPVDVRTGVFRSPTASRPPFGGFTPAISTYLIRLTGNRAMPGVWLSFAAACGWWRRSRCAGRAWGLGIVAPLRLESAHAGSSGRTGPRASTRRRAHADLAPGITYDPRIPTLQR